ncbi:MAG: hypothetical protein HC769_27605 [Cyanobacteria bacterium CRU_2_1]|nr:hypothetical protein [Cyanobacteria bacterium RU_5_0]NJR62257.1 hypothetical protein [Cyanobacteria bacterium CRU_2_1]
MPRFQTWGGKRLQALAALNDLYPLSDVRGSRLMSSRHTSAGDTCLDSA